MLVRTWTSTGSFVRQLTEPVRPPNEPYTPSTMIQSFLKRHRKFRFFSNQAKVGGFTLIELLVAMVIASLISMGLLFMVVQLIQTNLREAARSDTQRDLQAAIDYIARDVREAVYVYDASCLVDRPTTTHPTTGISPSSCPGLRNYLPDSIMNTSSNVPVLAFWRLSPLPNTVLAACASAATAYTTSPSSLPTAIQGVPCLTGQMYSLVVYSLDNAARVGSRGRARITRYELPQYTNGSVRPPQPSGITPAPDLTPGWADPTGNATDNNPTSFISWPVSAQMLNGTLTAPSSKPTGNSLVLTDFVDWNGLYNRSGGSVTLGQAPNRSGESLILTPADGTPTPPPRGFYVYVRGAQNGGSLNQQVVIRIQGDAAGRPGIPNIAPLTQPVVPIALEATVVTRGVTNKTQ